MKYYPVSLDIKNRKCLVVGGGSVGTRKAVTLLNCGAAVTVISLRITKKLKDLENNSRISVLKRSYTTSDMKDAFLVIGATSDEELNRKIYMDAERLNKLCNIADQPELCNFILPSIVSRGDLVLTISTSGKSPAYAKKLRKMLESEYGEEHNLFLRLMGSIRKKILHEKHEPEFHKLIFEELVNAGLIEMIRCGDKGNINRVLKEILGEGYDFEALINIDE